MNRYSCIFLGPNRVELITAQRGRNRKLKIIDRAYYPLDIDYEIFDNGVITNTTTDLLEKIIGEYIRLAEEYSPEKIELIFSHEITRANNFLFVYYRLNSLFDNCQLRIVSDDEELNLFSSAAKLYLPEIYNFSSENSLIASINSEQINFALTNNGIIDYTDQIPYGYLKISELVERITKQRTHYSKLLSEILESKLRLAIMHIGKRKLKYVCLITKDAVALSQVVECDVKGNLYIFSKKAINDAYHKVKELTPEQLKTLYPDLSEVESITLQSTIIVARQLLNTAKANEIVLIHRNLAETIVELQFQITKRKEIDSWLEEGAYQSAIALSERYFVDQKHAELIEKYALQLFNFLKPRFNLTKREKKYLKLATRLMDVGQYGGEDGQSKAVEEIVNREEIIGLSKEDRRIIGRICYNVKVNDYGRTQNLEGFEMDEALIIAQVTAIIKLVATLDQSRRQKVSKLSYSIKDNNLIVKVITSHNTQLESYYFERDSKWIRRVFELSPELKVKRVKT